MATRGLYIFKVAEDNEESFVVYKHYDNYPKCALKFIYNAIQYAWQLPRYEPCEFACAFIAANKQKNGGDIYLTHMRAHMKSDMGQEFEYTIFLYNHELHVKIFDVNKKTSETDSLYEWMKEYGIEMNDSQYGT